MQPEVAEKEAIVSFIGIGIPAEVFFHPSLTAIEQKLFGLVRNISKSERGCWATNRWLGNLLNVNPSTISAYVSNLQKEGFFTVEFVKKPKTVTNETERRIFINESYTTKYKKLVQRANNAIQNGLFDSSDFYTTKSKRTPLAENDYPPTVENEGGYNTGRTNKVIEEVNDEDQNQNLTMSVGGNSLNTRRTRTTEKQEILPLQQSLTTKRLKRPSVYQTLAIQLAKIVDMKHKITTPLYEIEKWAKDIKKLCEEKSISTERVQITLAWFSKHVDDEFMYKVESGLHLRKKFISIEEKMNKKPYSTKTQSTQPSKGYSKGETAYVD